MADPYWRYAASADRGTVPMPSFPGYMPAEASSLTSHHLWSSNDLRGSSSDFLQKDVLPLRPGAYGFDDGTGIGVHRDSVSGVSGLAAGASIKGYPSLEDPNLISQRQDVALGITRGVADAVNERPNSLKKVDGLPIPTGESNILFVDGLPNDCTRREGGDRAMVFCFVEFTDEKCALTALEALQGYKFDDRKPDSSVLRLHFAHFPFCLPSDRDDQKFGVAR
ncbi:RNA-binding protein 2-like isoform X4 [Malania oleifera]|uniref:RNA-binding protein 2-like isoform X4 n=1 Tax=Malania oleifera TaxID=397392 RepID=UPI0025ADDF4A|nr:RNA-binding protein 2-like isoform X4 [Malania oleifera]